MTNKAPEMHPEFFRSIGRYIRGLTDVLKFLICSKYLILTYLRSEAIK